MITYNIQLIITLIRPRLNSRNKTEPCSILSHRIHVYREVHKVLKIYLKQKNVKSSVIKNIRGSRRRFPQGTRNIRVRADPWSERVCASMRYTMRASRAEPAAYCTRCIAEGRPRAAPILLVFIQLLQISIYRQ